MCAWPLVNSQMCLQLLLSTQIGAREVPGEHRTLYFIERHLNLLKGCVCHVYISFIHLSQKVIKISVKILSKRNVRLSVCCSHISRIVHSMYFTLGRFVTEDPGKCGVDFGAVFITRWPLWVLCNFFLGVLFRGVSLKCGFWANLCSRWSFNSNVMLNGLMTNARYVIFMSRRF